MEVSGLWELEWNSSIMDSSLWNKSLMGGFDLLRDGGALVPSDVLFRLQMFITFVYLVVCAAGLLGNGLVMYLIWAQKGSSTPVINIFVFGLAVADFQFSLTLPFWATETALDFNWPFGEAMCKAVPSLTILSIYFNVFLLTAMSVTRYWSLASALKDGSKMSPRMAKWITAALWAIALGATIPTTIYATVMDVASVKLCIFKFPTPYPLRMYHLQRVVFTFVIPLAVILTSYFLLLRLLKAHHVNSNKLKRQNQVATTVQLVVGCFFVCWFPNHVVTVWGVLVKFKAVPMSDAFHFLHTYIFPLTTCLAHTNSCLNPILYCLMRQEFREAIKGIFQRLSYQHFSCHKTWEEDMLVALPLSPSQNHSNPQSGEKEDSTFSTILEPRTKEPKLLTVAQLIPGVEMPM
ncbi:relaxin-3 receptor 2 [Rhineura floridana]|uniref:relaxin-3 receptor 2 n=1 Tax=Rhineura floridana TaxID=261503 RepID=UPI002AC85233|nr:relaxin-3 receptor 2 [Rhineura floridana]